MESESMPKSLLDAERCLQRAKEILTDIEKSLPPKRETPKHHPQHSKGVSPFFVIDFDLVARLRQQKKYKEADRMVRIYQKKVRLSREKEQVEEELQKRKDYRKILDEERRLKIELDLCRRTSCSRDAEEGKTFCKQCREVKERWRKKHERV